MHRYLAVFALAAVSTRIVAPERVVAKKVGTGGRTIRTLHLFAYPRRAAYNGSGSSDDEKSFTCK